MNMQVRPERQVISAVEVAAMLGFRCRESFSRSRREALEAAGFPRKLPGLNGWSRPAIMRWIENNGETAANDPTPPVQTPLERRFA